MTRKVTSLPVTEKTVYTTNADKSRLTVDRIIIHTEVGTQSAADHRFNDPNSRVSAHYGVGLDGSIWHWVDEDWVAYHAGDYPTNQRSIGIEHEDGGLYNSPRPDALYITSANLVADICKFYNIPCDRQHILGHNEIIATGCPDSLDVERIVNEAKLIVNPIVNQPNTAITDQTLLDTPSDGKIEFRTIKSLLSDRKRDLGNAQTQLIAMDAKDREYLQTIGDLTKQLQDALSHVSNSTIPTLTLSDRIKSWWMALFAVTNARKA